VAALTLSAIGHLLVLGGLAAAIIWTGWTNDRTYVVNLVPAVAAVGTPAGVSQPSLPARPAPVQPPRSTLPEPEPREARSREPLKLPESAPPLPRLASRAATLPRPGDKELPPLSSPSDRRTTPTPTPAARPAETPAEARPAPPPALGQATGSPAGAGALSLDASDFPHAWYLRQVLQKVEERWQRQGQVSEPSQKPLVLVEIQRDGSIRPPRIEKSSGNTFYDQAALRAITDASPFPPLPTDWTRASLRVMFRFDLRNERG
jgi:protein TonB